MSGAPLFPLAQRVHGPGARAGRPAPSLPSCRGLAGGQRSRSGAIATGPAAPAMEPTPRSLRTPRPSPGMGFQATQPPRGLPRFILSRFRGCSCGSRRCCERWTGSAGGSCLSPPPYNRSGPTPDLCLAAASAFPCHVFLPPQLGFFPSCNTIPSPGPSLYPCWQLLILLPLPVPSPSRRCVPKVGPTPARGGAGGDFGGRARRWRCSCCSGRGTSAIGAWRGQIILMSFLL